MDFVFLWWTQVRTFFVLFGTVTVLLPQWGTADAEIKVPSVENTELTTVLPSKSGGRQDIAMVARPLPEIYS